METSRAERLAYVAGTLSALGLVALIILFSGYRIGFPALLEVMRKVLKPTEDVLYLPKPLLKELVELEAVVDNAGNPTEQSSHYTILVERDERLGWKLKPNAHIVLYMLRALNPLNFDPPVIALKSDAKISEALRQYLEQQTRLRYEYSVDRYGFRTTIPSVATKDRPLDEILMVGDSVLFGEGVNDDQTMASHLQTKVGGSYRVINAGVGGYAGEQALEMAKRQSEATRYAALIYVACQNDFMNHAGVSYLEQAREILTRFAALRPTFAGRVVVLLTPYMEYVLDDVMLKDGWWREMVDQTNELRRGFPALCVDLGLECRDAADVFPAYMRRSGSIFARFALYIDDAHFSPLGNELAADAIYDALKGLGVRSSGVSVGEP